MTVASLSRRILAPGLVAVGLAAASGLGTTALAGAAFAATCAPAGATGLTTLKVAHSGQTVTGTINAAGCDIGVYVGPGSSNVTIKGVTITGARDHAILVENATNVTIENSTIINNGAGATTCAPGGPASKTPCINENKPIELVGTTTSLVKDNLVANNTSDGGIGIADNGKVDPGALKPGIAHAGSDNLVEGNTIVDNSGGCGVVIAAYNPGAGVDHNRVIGNTVAGNVAGVVVAADSPATIAAHNVVEGNTITDNFLPGVIVHSNTPGDVVSGTLVLNNILGGNGGDKSADAGKGPKGKTAIVVVAEPRPKGFPPGLPDAVLRDTTISQNTIAGERAALFTANATHTTFGVNTIATGESILGLHT